jgi:hypothetical protein
VRWNVAGLGLGQPRGQNLSSFDSCLGGGVDVALRRQYDVAPDGRFLINTALDSAATPITLLQNWHPEAKN